MGWDELGGVKEEFLCVVFGGSTEGVTNCIYIACMYVCMYCTYEVRVQLLRTYSHMHKYKHSIVSQSVKQSVTCINRVTFFFFWDRHIIFIFIPFVKKQPTPFFPLRQQPCHRIDRNMKKNRL